MLGKNKNAKPDHKELKTYGRSRINLSQISDEIVLEILLRLPVKTILQFKSVCKAWYAIISHPSFIRMHLQQSASRYTQQPSFLVAPHTLGGMDGGDKFRLLSYRWQEGQSDVSPVYARDFGTETAWCIHCVCIMSHCDGLVLVPTSTSIYVINPAIGDILRLPDIQKDHHDFVIASVGFGLDSRSNKYKVAHYFYRSIDISKGTYDAGMEVFTIGGSHWRETVEVPPYPLDNFREVVYSKTKGSLFWHVSVKQQHQKHSQGIVCFRLDDEGFSFVPKPYSEPDVQPFMLVELGGQLCLAQSVPTKLVIWVLMDGVNHMWDRRYVIDISILWGISKYRPQAMPRAMLNGGGILVQYGYHLVRFNLGSEGQNIKELAVLDQMKYKDPKGGGGVFKHGSEFYYFDVVPYMESLVPLRPGAS